MHYYIDVKYLNLISSQLNKFKKTKDNTWNCRCPLCGDSKKNPNKCRGYFFKVREQIFYKCHNCSASQQFGTFLKQLNVRLYDEYVLERYKNGAAGRVAHKIPKKKQLKPKNKKTADINLPCVKNLSGEHFVKQYVKKRKIPQIFWNRLYFAEDFAKWVNKIVENDKYKNLEKKDARLVLPFFDINGKIIGGQGRSLTSNDKKIRYITFKCENVEKLVFGLERWNKKEKTYLVEGPIDSLFLPNALAASNPDLKSLHDYLNDLVSVNDITLIFDNEPRNKEILQLTEKAIKKGMNVVIWPQNVKEKDINDMILLGAFSPKELHNIINMNTFSGLEAHVKFNNWKKR